MCLVPFSVHNKLPTLPVLPCAVDPWTARAQLHLDDAVGLRLHDRAAQASIKNCPLDTLAVPALWRADPHTGPPGLSVQAIPRPVNEEPVNPTTKTPFSQLHLGSGPIGPPASTGWCTDLEGGAVGLGRQADRRRPGPSCHPAGDQATAL